MNKTAFFNAFNLRRITLGEWFLFLLAVLYAFGSLHSKMLGVTWALFSIIGIIIACRLPASHNGDTSFFTNLARVWLLACLASLCLELIGITYWSDSFLEASNPHLRLLLPATATYLLFKKNFLPKKRETWLWNAIATACLMVAIYTLYIEYFSPKYLRDSVTTNVIPWAVGISFLPCLLLPVAANTTRKWYKCLWYIASFGAVIAVLLTQTRGALFIIPWYCLLLVWFNLPARCPLSIKLTSTALIAVFISALLCSAVFWLKPQIKSRLYSIYKETNIAINEKRYDTSVGSRLYLWGLAIEDIRQSPWIGVGSENRLDRIQNTDMNNGATRTLTHAHNQYFHSMWSYGIPGLLTILAPLIGLFLMIKHLVTHSVAGRVAAWQLAGVAAMHITGSLTNVNLNHNYYVMALSLAVIIPLWGAYFSALPHPMPAKSDNSYQSI